MMMISAYCAFLLLTQKLWLKLAHALPMRKTPGVLVVLMLVALLMFVPIEGLVFYQQVFAITGYVSITAYFVCIAMLCAVLSEGRLRLYRLCFFTRCYLLAFLLVFYLASLGAINPDIYAQGFVNASYNKALVCLFVALVSVLFYLNQVFWALCISAALLAWQCSLFESTNMFDYLFDIWLFLLLAFSCLANLLRLLAGLFLTKRQA